MKVVVLKMERAWCSCLADVTTWAMWKGRADWSSEMWRGACCEGVLGSAQGTGCDCCKEKPRETGFRDDMLQGLCTQASHIYFLWTLQEDYQGNWGVLLSFSCGKIHTNESYHSNWLWLCSSTILYFLCCITNLLNFSHLMKMKLHTLK